MMSDGRYVLNGDWSIAWPGPLEVAGTRLRYARAPDGTESLEAPGPTAEDLHLMVMLGTAWGRGQPPPAPIAPLSTAPARTGPAAGAQPRHRVRVLAAPRAPPAWPWGHQPPAAAPAPGGRQPPAPRASGHPGPCAASTAQGLCHGATTEKPPQPERGQGCHRCLHLPGVPTAPLGALLWFWGVPGVLHEMGTLKKVPLA